MAARGSGRLAGAPLLLLLECDDDVPGGWHADTFLLPGSTIDQPSDSVTKAVTIYISSSARPKDEGNEVVQRLLEAVNSARTMLQLHAARAIVAFDGLQGKPSVTDEVARSYASKIRRVRTALPAHVDVLVHEMWLHQANSLRCAMLAMPRTPLVFVMQDDVQLASPVRTALLVPLLTASLEPPRAGPVVEYVRMSQKADCYNGRGRIFPVMTPCSRTRTRRGCTRSTAGRSRPLVESAFDPG